MTVAPDPRVGVALRQAAISATLASSVYNTQPWRFVLGAASLEVHADWTRRLMVLDPRGRQLLISCGCAIFNARVALAAAGYAVTVTLLPDTGQPDLLARLSVSGAGTGPDPIAALGPVLTSRRTNLQPSAEDPPPVEVVEVLIAAAAAEGAELVAVTRGEHRQAIGRLNRQAQDEENLDPAYVAELRAWTSGGPHRRDGLAPSALFDEDATLQDGDQCLLLLGTRHDTPIAWVRAGQALERVFLEVARLGFAVRPLMHLIQVASTHGLLRAELELTSHPHVLLRVGSAPATPASRRRRFADTIKVAP